MLFNCKVIFVWDFNLLFKHFCISLCQMYIDRALADDIVIRNVDNQLSVLFSRWTAKKN